MPLSYKKLMIFLDEQGIISHVQKEWRSHINTPEGSQTHKGTFGCNLWAAKSKIKKTKHHDSGLQQVHDALDLTL